jgi:dihydrofolate synthase/folylpolyglutamate synthase
MERLNAASDPPWRDALKEPHRFRTAFEFMTMAALVEFGRRRRDLPTHSTRPRQIVCWETGLGGRLDCTNVVDPLVSVITTLGLDHTAILGETIEQIAFEKAGIVKPHRPVVVARQTPEFDARVLPVIQQRAEEWQAPLFLAWETCPVVAAQETPAGQTVEFQLPGGSRHAAFLPLHGPFQQRNLEAALTAVWLAIHMDESKSASLPRTDGISLHPAELGRRLAQGIDACRWPGRLEINLAPSGQALVLDGAHCPLSAAAVADALLAWRSVPVLPLDGRIEVLWGMQRDKKHREFLAALVRPEVRDLFGTIHAYRVTGVRGAEADLLAEAAVAMGLSAKSHTNAQTALEAAINTGRNVLAVGTLYTLAELREHWKVGHSLRE